MAFVPGVACFAWPLRVSCTCTLILVAAPAAAQSGDTGSPEPPAGAGASSAAPPPGATGAPSAPPFGARGQIAVFGGSTIAASASQLDGIDLHGVQATFSPEVDFFVAHNFSLGLAIGLTYGNVRDGTILNGYELREQTLGIAGGPRVGLNVPFGNVVSWFPRATLGIEWNRDSGQVVSVPQSNGQTATTYYLPTTKWVSPYLDVYAPLLFRPASHLLVGFGPRFDYRMGGPSDGLSQQRITVGASLVVGGYGGGPEPQSDAAPTPESERFGEAGQWVVTNALTASVFSSTYTRPNSSLLGGGIGGSVDYFVGRRVSVGGAVSLSAEQATTPAPPSGDATRSRDYSATIGPRLGVALRIADALSLYPIAEVDVGAENYDASAGTIDQRNNTVVVALRLLTPLLVHPVPHFFVGVGPSYYHEFLHRMTPANTQSPDTSRARETSVSLALILGGWL
jgi:hypothetical protein